MSPGRGTPPAPDRLLRTVGITLPGAGLLAEPRRCRAGQGLTRHAHGTGHPVAAAAGPAHVTRLSIRRTGGRLGSGKFETPVLQSSLTQGDLVQRACVPQICGNPVAQAGFGWPEANTAPDQVVSGSITLVACFPHDVEPDRIPGRRLRYPGNHPRGVGCHGGPPPGLFLCGNHSGNRSLGLCFRAASDRVPRRGWVALTGHPAHPR